MNLPVEGEPVALYQYFHGNLRQHLLGIAGGLIWCTGAIANFVAASAPKSVQVGPAISYAIGQGATMVSALWGLLVWHEFAAHHPGPDAAGADADVLYVGWRCCRWRLCSQNSADANRPEATFSARTALPSSPRRAPAGPQASKSTCFKYVIRRS